MEFIDKTVFVYTVLQFLKSVNENQIKSITFRQLARIYGC